MTKFGEKNLSFNGLSGKMPGIGFSDRCTTKQQFLWFFQERNQVFSVV